MKTKSFTAKGYSQILCRSAALTAAIVAASALAFAQPVFAQANTGSDPDNPEPWGSTTVASSPDPLESPPSVDQPWAYTNQPSHLQSFDGPPLVPAPEQPFDPEEAGSMYVAPPPTGMLELPGHTPINPTSPELIPPDSFARPDGGFHNNVP
jgi:hypothetical protein